MAVMCSSTVCFTDAETICGYCLETASKRKPNKLSGGPAKRGLLSFSYLPHALFRVTIKTRKIAEKGGAAMIRIALVEDEAEVRAQLQGYVQRHTRQYGTEFAVTERFCYSAQ